MSSIIAVNKEECNISGQYPNTTGRQEFQPNQHAELQAIQYSEHETNVQVVGNPETERSRWVILRPGQVRGQMPRARRE